MTRYGPSFKALAIGLAALAGYVDAVGFLRIGGLFVSFMSGNSTRLAIGLANHSEVRLVAGSLIASFVIGVIVGSLTAAKAGRHRKPVILALVTACLTGAAVLDTAHHASVTTAAMAAAMGATNAIFQRDGEVTIGVTYMTGTLVKFGQRIAAALLGGERWGWAPYLALWVGLLSGGYCGAMLYGTTGTGALWVAAAYAASLTLLATALGTSPTPIS